MAPRDGFRVFPELPLELQYMIWKIHRESRPIIRHYMIQTTTTKRSYYALDVQKNVLINTFIDKNSREFTDCVAHPEAGEEYSPVKIMPVDQSFPPRPSSAYARSLMPCIKLKYSADVVYLKDLTSVDRWFTPLLPVAKPTREHHHQNIGQDHWISKVQKLAIDLHSSSARELKRHPGDHVFSRMPNLRILYLISINVGCYCMWEDEWATNPPQLNEDGYVPLEDTVRLHPPELCNIGRCAQGAADDIKSLKERFGSWADVVEVRVVSELDNKLLPLF